MKVREVVGWVAMAASAVLLIGFLLLGKTFIAANLLLALALYAGFLAAATVAAQGAVSRLRPEIAVAAAGIWVPLQASWQLSMSYLLHGRDEVIQTLSNIVSARLFIIIFFASIFGKKFRATF